MHRDGKRCIIGYPALRITMKGLIEIGVISSVGDTPRGFTQISIKN